MVYAGVVSQMQVDDGHGSPAPLPTPTITPNLASVMRMKLEDRRSGGFVSERGNSNVHDEVKSFDTAQDLSGLGNCIVVEDEDELPTRILNSAFSDTLFSSERTPELLTHRRLRVRCTCVMSIGISHHRLNLSSNAAWRRSSWQIVHLHRRPRLLRRPLRILRVLSFH